MPIIKFADDGEVEEIIQALYVAASTNEMAYGPVRHKFLARLHEARDRKEKEEVPRVILTP